MSSHEKLSAASNDRKARLAQLKSLKRKQAPTDDDQPTTTALDVGPSSTTDPVSSALTTSKSPPDSVTTTYLSGRNFDPSTRNVKLGFENTPVADPTSTLEYKAEQLALASRAEQAASSASEPLDLFKLQPKKPNWDLKRDLAEKMKVLDVQTENAIARLVRERVEGVRRARVEAQKQIGGTGSNGEGGEEVGMEGSEFVEAMHLREKEDEAERQREEEELEKDVS